MEAKGKKHQEKDKKITFNPSVKLRDKKKLLMDTQYKIKANTEYKNTKV